MYVSDGRMKLVIDSIDGDGAGYVNVALYLFYASSCRMVIVAAVKVHFISVVDVSFQKNWAIL